MHIDATAQTAGFPAHPQRIGEKNRDVSASAIAADGGLTPEERQQVEALKKRDREVRAHEAAHLAAAGGNAVSGARFSYTRGPDSRLYAVGGEVAIDTSAVSGDPDATLRKARAIQAAALAPGDPSAQDRQVAAQAAVMAAEASRQIAEQRQAETAGDADGAGRLLNRIRGDGSLGEDKAAASGLRLDVMA